MTQSSAAAVQSECERCGAEFRGKRANRRYCSENCRKRASEEKKRLSEAPVMPERSASADEAPPAPDRLDERAAEVWERIYACTPADADLDQDLVALFASLVSRSESMCDEVEAGNWVARGASGQLVAHPLIGPLERAEARLVMISDRLGLSPKARARLGWVPLADPEPSGE